MNGSRYTATLFVAALAVLCVSSGCAHAFTTPQLSQRPQDENPRERIAKVLPLASGRLRTWMNIPPHNSWDNDPDLGTMLDFGVVNQSVSAGPQSQRLVQMGVTSVEYTNPNRQAESGDPNPEYSSDERTFSHASEITTRGLCSLDPGTRLYRSNDGNRYYQMEPDNRQLARLWAQEIVNFTAPAQPPDWPWAFGGARTYVFEDVADNLDSLDGMPCGFRNNDNWTALSIELLANANAAYLAKSGQAMPDIIYNGLNPRMSGDIRPALGLNASQFVAGGEAEDCYVRAGSSSTIPVQDVSSDHSPWSALENTEIRMAQAGKLFICVGSAPPVLDASRLTHQRLYQVASILLTFDQATSIIGEAYPTKTHFQVFPESLISPTNPVVAQPASIDGLVIASSGASHLYGREYRSCPVGATIFSACYVVVNPSTSAIAFHWPAIYIKTVKIWGSDFLDPPAWISTSGVPPPAVVEAGTAVIALPKR